MTDVHPGLRFTAGEDEWAPRFQVLCPWPANPDDWVIARANDDGTLRRSGMTIMAGDRIRIHANQ